MQLSIKRVLTLFAGVSTLLGLGAATFYGISVYRQTTQREVWIDCDSAHLEGASYGPVTALTDAVSKDKFSARFKVRWSDGDFNSWSEGWMLYDRRKRSLEFEDTTRGEFFNSHYTYAFTNVTDDVLAEYSGTSVSLFDLPTVLPLSGCTAHKIAAAAKSSPPH